MGEAKEKMVARMTDLIADIAHKNNGRCSKADLKAAGFTDYEIEGCFARASGYAAVQTGAPILDH